ncbi:MAG: mannose-6-phosphate isomerase [Conexibacter sp.]|nr:mannose-6-phosphate isomerase [Conexibacter sp.]
MPAAIIRPAAMTSPESHHPPPAPVELPPNRLERFYHGGARIDALRGVPGSGPRASEDWVGSTTTVLGEASLGLSRLPDGTVLRAAIAADPEGYLGPAHVARFGDDPALLVKLLDAGERLPVHAHPDRGFAERHLGQAHGKAEAWVIVDAAQGATVHLGLREPVAGATLRRWVDDQDAGAMLASLHEVPVAAGDTLFVPPGMLHSIGEGIFLIELQEPSDLSVMAEFHGFDLAPGAEHMALGFDVALAAVDAEPAQPELLVRRAPAPTAELRDLLAPGAAGFFAAQRVAPQGDAPVALQPSFAVLVVLDGTGTLRTEDGTTVPLTRGATWLVPYGAGRTEVGGAVSVLRCLPPSPPTTP